MRSLKLDLELYRATYFKVNRMRSGPAVSWAPTELQSMQEFGGPSL